MLDIFYIRVLRFDSAVKEVRAVVIIVTLSTMKEHYACMAISTGIYLKPGLSEIYYDESSTF